MKKRDREKAPLEQPRVCVYSFPHGINHRWFNGTHILAIISHSFSRIWLPPNTIHCDRIKPYVRLVYVENSMRRQTKYVWNQLLRLVPFSVPHQHTMESQEKLLKLCANSIFCRKEQFFIVKISVENCEKLSVIEIWAKKRKKNCYICIIKE